MNFRKIMNMVVFTTIVCVLSISAQKRIISKDISSREYKVEDFSGKDYVLLKKKFGDITEFYLANKRNDPDLTINGEKEKLFSFHKDDKVQLIQFSNSGEQVVFSRLKNDKKVWEVYDIKTRKYKTVESEEGSVTVASFYDMNNILYRVSLKHDRPRIYLIKDNKDPVFIDNGFTAKWSNNTNYFLIELFQNAELSLFEKKRYGKISKEEYINQLKAQGGPQREIFSKYVICNADGQRLLVLEDFNIVDWIQWSPDNKKIIIQERGDRGFKIVYLDYISESNIVIKNVYHFPGFPKFERQTSTFCQSPKWSPDGNKILFITSVENGHSVLYDNIYILEDSSYNYYPINESQDSFIFKVDWISNKSIFMDSRNKITKEDFTHEITFE